MASVVTVTGAIQDSSSTLVRQLLGQDAELVTQASVASIDYEVIDISDPGTPVGVIPLTGLTIGDVIFDVPILDGRWTLDLVGYNFRLILPTIAFPLPNPHRVNVIVSWSNGDPDVNYPFDVQVLPSYPVP